MRNPLDAYRDPQRRPVALVWTIVGVSLLALAYVGSQLITSRVWFCNSVCHAIHADNKRAYYNAKHDRISCIACHYPAGMHALAFAFDRVDKLLDIGPTVTGRVEQPINPFSHLAMSTSSLQCLQCHDIEKGPRRTSQGIIMNHDVHRARGIRCPLCHNRAAHRELTPTLPGNRLHEDWTRMTACFRCHSQTGDSPSEQFDAPGTCSVCHERYFDVVPASHEATGWLVPGAATQGHGEAAREESASVAEVTAEWGELEEEFYSERPRLFARVGLRLAGYEETITVRVPPAGTIHECLICHLRPFCDSCHSRSGGGGGEPRRSPAATSTPSAMPTGSVTATR